MKMKIDVRLTNGKEDSCVLSEQDALTVAETFIEKQVLMVGKMGDYISLYPAHAVAAMDMYSWED